MLLLTNSNFEPEICSSEIQRINVDAAGCRITVSRRKCLNYFIMYRSHTGNIGGGLACLRFLSQSICLLYLFYLTRYNNNNNANTNINFNSHVSNHYNNDNNHYDDISNTIVPMHENNNYSNYKGINNYNITSININHNKHNTTALVLTHGGYGVAPVKTSHHFSTSNFINNNDCNNNTGICLNGVVPICRNQ